MEKLILIGGGGHCRSCIEAIESEKRYRIVGILDRREKVGERNLQYEIVGTDEDMAGFIGDDVSFLVTIGQVETPDARIRLFDRLVGLGARIATVRASTAQVSRHAESGCGTVFLHGSLVNAGARVGKNVIINTAAVVEHDASVGDHSHISTGAVVNGSCRIRERVFIGSNAVIRHQVSVCAGTVIGAGSVVVRNIDQPGVYAGNPVRRLR